MDELPRGASLTSRYRPDIDGLRAIAVALVVAYHAFPHVVPGGFIGVDVFFVISGFLITGLILEELRAGTFRLTAFYRRRVRRIVPALLLVFLICGFIGWYVLLPGEFRWLGRTLAWCAPFLANAYFAKTGSYFDTASERNPLLHLWSLGVEEQFYLIWPVLLLVAVRYRATRALLLTVCAGSLTLSVLSIWHSPEARFYVLATRAWELGAGGLLAFLPGKLSSSPQIPAAIGLLLIGTGALLLNSDLAFPGAWGLVPTCGAVLLLAAGPASAINRVILSNGPMTFLGRISYPLYLWHWPMLSFARIALGQPPSTAITVEIVAFSCVAGYLTYRYVEKPIRAGVFPRKAVPCLLTGLAVVAFAGLAFDARRIEGRLVGPEIAVLDEAIDDWHYPGGFNFRKNSGFRTFETPSHRPQTVLFVGDSHMEQYWPRVKYLIDAHPDAARSALFATNVGCPPLPGINSTRRGWSCDAFFKYVMQQASRSDVDSVVFGAFWEVYLSGEYSADHSRHPIYNIRDGRRTPLLLDSSGTQAALDDFQRALTDLVHSGRRVFIVLSNPTSPLFDPLSLLPVQARLLPLSAAALRIDVNRQSVDVQSFEDYVAPITARLREVAARVGAEVIDPRPALCENTLCPAVTPEGVPLYIDSNHLRAFFAREHAVFLDKILLGAT